MGEFKLQKEESIRIAAPILYRRMIETFEKYNIHPYDAHGTVIKTQDCLEITIRHSNSFTEIARTEISFEQALQPDEKLTCFFEQAAEKCKNQLITDYFKMIKL
ncbi:hypothetical protein [Cytobacillus massiliigabonensis]|uniref:hypothetical protein n=1 Tax=Cytobacillus massiliigabonensis TaxID=1871011 RepID=UPI000C859CE7|nr:hypothetical protein [Cytobacillus massiliigabonensis]